MYPQSHNTARSGFGAIEMIFYVAILVVLLVVVINALLFAIDAYRDLSVSRNITASAIAAMDRMTREIHAATSIDLANSTFDANPGTLRLVPGDIDFYVEDNVLKVEDGVKVHGDIILPGTIVTNLVFRHITTDTSEGVRIELQLQSAGSGITKTENFYTTVMLRNSY